MSKHYKSISQRSIIDHLYQFEYINCLVSIEKKKYIMNIYIMKFP